MSDTHWVVLMNFTDIAYGTYLGGGGVGKL